MKIISYFIILLFPLIKILGQNSYPLIFPSSTEIVQPIHKVSFDNLRQCPKRIQGGNPKEMQGLLVFSGSTDGNRQVDPQIAIGGGYVVEASNRGILIFDKKGNYINGVSQKCFNDGIDPKLYFDLHNKNFVFDLWWYYDEAKKKPVNIAVSESNDPNGAWNIYPISRPKEVDGGGIGYSKKWIGYSYPGGEENTFVLRNADAKAGRPTTIYHFNGSLGSPILNQDNTEDLYFFEITDDSLFVIRKLSEDKNGMPYAQIISSKKHHQKYIDYPPPSPQKDTSILVASGDRNPKNIVLQNGFIWFSQAIDYHGVSAVQWFQIHAHSGEIIQTGLIKSDTSSYIQTSIAVNKKMDVLIGFQETGKNMYISPRFTYRKSTDPKGTVREIIRYGEGQHFIHGQAWGDYSGSLIDGDNRLDLWTIQSIPNQQGKGETLIAKLPYRLIKKKTK